jgi:hypothetical protein
MRGGLSGVLYVPPVLLFLVFACVRPQALDRYAVTSEQSDYSPTVRLAINVDTTSTSIVVRVDSGSVTARGLPQGEASAVMRNLVLDMLVVATERIGGGDVTGAPWRVLVESNESIRVDSLRAGVPKLIGPQSFTAPRPRDLRTSWILFRVRGDVIAGRQVGLDGSVVPARVKVGGRVTPLELFCRLLKRCG